MKIKTEVIDTQEQIRDLVDWMIFRHEPPTPPSPTIYIDLEGVYLSREGTISIFTLLLDTGIPTRRVCLIDVHTLGAEAFDVAGSKQKTLKDILQDEKIPKVFFDVRNDSDALFAHFRVALQGVEDVQLMESATRTTTISRRFLTGLAKCIEENMLIALGRSGLASWRSAKEKGERLFKAEHGGSYEVFNKRPISEEIIAYCVGDVQFLPDLRDKFWRGRSHQWHNLVIEESKKRVAASQRPDYQPHGPNRAMAPWSKEQNALLNQWNYVSPRTHLDSLIDPDDDWYDDGGPFGGKDILNDCDIPYYYSD